ncbi:MAG: Uma2 family endonuclease [Prochlorotrichaceae cyanobacterium]
MVTLQLRQLSIPLGQRLLIHDLGWREFEAVLGELGEKRSSTIAYSGGTLEIRMPLPEHEVDKELIGDFVKMLLEELELDCECFGSTTFKNQKTESGLEPDQCFYIQNHEQMRGRRRINLEIDPPPDLAIEVDVTSKTQIDAYRGLGVPELWVYEDNQLKLYALQSGQYQSVEISPLFPNFPLSSWVAELLAQSREMGRSPALRAFRQKIRAALC